MNRSSGLLSILLMIALLSFGSGCEGLHPPLTCPQAGGPPWHEVATPHFALKTDMPVARAKKLADTLEISRAALMAALGAPAFEDAVPVRVVFFARMSDFRQSGAPEASDGYYSSQLGGDMENQPTLVIHDDLRYQARRTLQHELTHQIVRRHAGKLPWWISEGLAEAYSTMEVDGDEAIVGEMPRDAGYWVETYRARDPYAPVPKLWFPVDRAPSASDLAGATRQSITEQDRGLFYYLSAWKMIHVLRGHYHALYEPRFQTMLKGLMAGKTGQMAFADAYPGKRLADFEDEYRKVLLDGHEHTTRIKFTVPALGEPKVTRMSDPEVHALWAILRKDVTSGNAEIERALKEHPKDTSLILTRAGLRSRLGDRKGAQADLWSVPVTERETAQFLYFSVYNLLGFLADEADVEAQAIRMAALTPLVDRLSPRASTAMQRRAAAVALLVLGRNGEAMALSQKAIEVSPACAECFEVHARALLSNGRFAAAADAVERALTLLPDERSSAPLVELFHFIESEAAKHAAGRL